MTDPEVTYALSELTIIVEGQYKVNNMLRWWLLILTILGLYLLVRG